MTNWAELASAYALYLRAIGRPRTTIELRSWQVAHTARVIDKPPAEVTTDDLLALLAAEQWSPETRRSYRSGIRDFFGWARRGGHIDLDPAECIPQIKVPRAGARPCPEEVLRSALERADPRGRMMLRLASEAGLRRAEICQVHSKDVVDGPSLRVKGKGGHVRIVPITDSLAAPILAADGYLFRSQRGAHLTPRSVGVMASDLLGPDVTLHMLRHRFATRAYRGSRNLLAVQQLLGHANLSITQRYVDCDDDERRAAMLAAA
jgi:integrase/recombinase XerC